MVSDVKDRRNPRGSSFLSLGIFFALGYLLSGSVQILITMGIMADPIGIFQKDLIGGVVMIVISLIFISGVISYSSDDNRIRSYLIVGAFLSIFYGSTQALVTLSLHLTEVIGTADEPVGDIFFNLFAPSIILSTMMMILIPFARSMMLNDKQRSDDIP